MPDSLRSNSKPPNKVRLKSEHNDKRKPLDKNQCRRPYRLLYYKRLKGVVVGVVVGVGVGVRVYRKYIR